MLVHAAAGVVGLAACQVAKSLGATVIATAGGAACLGRPELGRLQPGAAADLALWPADDIADIRDPIAGLVLGPDR